MRVTVLGSGSSTGTPAVDLGWGACDPKNPKNRRRRPSILIEEGETRILVDTSPDLREQLLDAGVSRLDAVLFTHAHADHLHGIDDLREVNRAMRAPLDVYGDVRTLDDIRTRFGYVFEPLKGADDTPVFYKPVLIPHEVDTGERFEIRGIEIEAYRQDHGFSETLGFRFGDFSYSTDVTELSETAFEVLAGTRVWVIGTLLDKPHPTHAHVDKALDWIARIKPERAILGHLGVFLDYDILKSRLPAGVEPAYDGMILDIP